MIIDITRTINPAIAVWPGDTPFSLQQQMAIRDGHSVNLTTLRISAHTGTHADAPYHFEDSGPTLAALDLSIYWGEAQVVTVQKPSGPLTPMDFAHADLSRARRLLVRSAASDGDPTIFPSAIVHPTAELADFLAAQGIILYGADAPSMDAIDSKTLPGHHAMYRNGIAILENLNLRHAPDGVYELVALPLKIEGGDGSPVRAALRSLSDGEHAV